MFSQVTGVHSMDAQKCVGRGMGPTNRLENHGCEVTWVWHDGPRRSHGKCHARHVDVRTLRQGFEFTGGTDSGTGGTEVKTLLRWTRGT